MNSEELSLKSFIKEMEEVTTGFHPRKFCFVLGAGASRSSGIKSGEELVKIWDKELRERNETAYHQWRKDLSITDENMSSFYSQYYEKRFYRCPTDGYNYIEKIMESATPSAGYVMLAHLLTQTPHNVVITTNFDHLTEDAVNYYAQNTPLVIGHEALSHYISGEPVRPTIIKIHRDLLFDPKSRLEDLEELPDSWKNALTLIFTHYHPIFIGYAGNDKSLMDFLMGNAEKFANDAWKCPYWLLYKTEKLEGTVAEFLDRSGGFYVFHPGFDEVMIQLGATFNYSVPSEDTFLEDARNRYKALVDTINALSDTPKISNKTEAIVRGTETSTEALLSTEKDTEAEESVNQAITKIASQSEQQRMYHEATTLIRTEQCDKAVKILKDLIKIDENNARYHKSLGDALFNLNKDEDSLKEYRKAIQLEPRNADFYVAMSLLLINMKQPENAREVLQKAATVCQEDDDGNHFLIGILFRQIQQYSDALSEFRKASEIDPADSVYHYCIADMLQKLGDNEAAVEAAKESISCDPNYYRVYEVLSQALTALGQKEDAKKAKEKAEELKEAT